MMKIGQIVSRRRFERVSWDIVFRWESEIARALDLTIVDDERLTDAMLRRNGRRHWFRMANLAFPGLAGRRTTDSMSLVFEMDAWRDPGYNKRNVIPCIIDFQERSRFRLRCFSAGCDRCPLVLISSREAYDYLRACGVGLPLRHWALSVPDSLVGPENFTPARPFDMAIMGRCNPCLEAFARRYAERHPGFVYIRREVSGGRFAYVSSTGEVVGFAETYEDYLGLMKRARIGLYATPGMDGARPDARGFNQVTPRFLEYLACGCHVVARYPRNADTAFYEMDSIARSVEDYGQFERAVDRCRSEPVDAAGRLAYLSRHLSSVRANELKSILAGVE